MVRGPRHATLAGRVCGTVWEVHDGWWIGMGVGATPTVREGGGRAWDCAMGPEVGGRQRMIVFPFTSRGELVGGLRCRSGYYSHKRAGMAT
jgi:hypothetical protein